MSNAYHEKILFLRKAFGDVVVPKSKGDPAISCPKCKNPQKKKLAIRLDDDRVHCWVCGLGGKLITLLVTYRPSHVHEYVTKFAGKLPNSIEDAQVKHEVILPEAFQLLACLQESDDPNIKRAINYIKSRGLTSRDLWYFKFGISIDSIYHRRVIMPSFDANGELNYFTSRAIDKTTYRKYMNCDAEKKSIIFNEINIDWTKELTLVEGPFDLTKCDDNATCLLGSSLSEDSKLFSAIYKNKTPIVLALDNDMQEKTWQKIARMLSSYDISVRIIDLGKFKDVGEMTKKEFIAAKKSARAWDRESAIIKKIDSIRL